MSKFDFDIDKSVFRDLGHRRASKYTQQHYEVDQSAIRDTGHRRATYNKQRISCSVDIGNSTSVNLLNSANQNGISQRKALPTQIFNQEVGEVDSDEEKSMESGSDTEMSRVEEFKFERSNKKLTLQSQNDFRTGNRHDMRSPIVTHRSILKARRDQNHLAKSQ